MTEAAPMNGIWWGLGDPIAEYNHIFRLVTLEALREQKPEGKQQPEPEPFDPKQLLIEIEYVAEKRMARLYQERYP